MIHPWKVPNQFYFVCLYLAFTCGIGTKKMAYSRATYTTEFLSPVVNQEVVNCILQLDSIRAMMEELCPQHRRWHIHESSDVLRRVQTGSHHTALLEHGKVQKGAPAMNGASHPVCCSVAWSDS